MSRKTFGDNTVQSLLIHKDKIETHIVLGLVDVLAPLFQPGHLQRHVEVFAPFRLDDEEFAVRSL